MSLFTSEGGIIEGPPGQIDAVLSLTPFALAYA